MASPDGGARARQLFYRALRPRHLCEWPCWLQVARQQTRLGSLAPFDAMHASALVYATHACMQTQNSSSYFKAREQVESVLLWEEVYQKGND
jgi:hypothetical protein